MVFNDNAGGQVPRGALRFIASKLAPTGFGVFGAVGQCPSFPQGRVSLNRSSLRINLGLSPVQE
ncbi:hypothetical protein B0D71_01490 [Pseudomonas laurylsulfativorans]|uniref:Uncharacterized protein n=1 Tax=Pseudomonas laurylsulfativorans TaxID=1943631 RepID=A0A2S3VWQ0_9PSED|nr:hypothetical protein B0D71_01490 [Pseudomonas laurylsulfativorans]